MMGCGDMEEMERTAEEADGGGVLMVANNQLDAAVADAGEEGDDIRGAHAPTARWTSGTRRRGCTEPTQRGRPLLCHAHLSLLTLVR
jgi:hypothetical protein